jgi:hypothetical protein
VPVEGDGPPRYAFRHALVREVAYDDLLPTSEARSTGWSPRRSARNRMR